MIHSEQACSRRAACLPLDRSCVLAIDLGGSMARLSSALREIKNHYTIVVVGSGYGGAIAASRMARAGQKVAILERGREWQSGEFPNTEPEVLAE